MPKKFNSNSSSINKIRKKNIIISNEIKKPKINILTENQNQNYNSIENKKDEIKNSQNEENIKEEEYYINIHNQKYMNNRKEGSNNINNIFITFNPKEEKFDYYEEEEKKEKINNINNNNYFKIKDDNEFTGQNINFKKIQIKDNTINNINDHINKKEIDENKNNKDELNEEDEDDEDNEIENNFKNIEIEEIEKDDYIDHLNLPLLINNNKTKEILLNQNNNKNLNGITKQKELNKQFFPKKGIKFVINEENKEKNIANEIIYNKEKKK